VQQKRGNGVAHHFLTIREMAPRIPSPQNPHLLKPFGVNQENRSLIKIGLYSAQEIVLDIACPIDIILSFMNDRIENRIYRK